MLSNLTFVCLSKFFKRLEFPHLTIHGDHFCTENLWDEQLQSDGFNLNFN